MNRAVICILPLLATSLLAQDVLTVTPASPVVGSTVTVSYNPKAKAAVLRSPSNPLATVLAARSNDVPLMVEVPLKKSGTVWRGTFVVADKHIAYFFQVVDGDQTDNNNERAWDALVCDKDGTPVEGAYLNRGQAYLTGRAFTLKHERDVKAAVADFKQEIALHPGNLGGWLMSWTAAMQDAPGEATIDRIRTELDAFYDRVKEDEAKVAQLNRWFRTTGQQAKADSLRNAWVLRNPKGTTAENQRFEAAFRERDAVKRFALFESADADFPPKPEAQTNRDNQYVNFAISADEPSKAVARLKAMKQPTADLYNTLAWKFIEKGQRLEEAVEWARTGVELARKDDPAEKPAYMTSREWANVRKSRLAYVLDTYAYGLEQLGRPADAEPAYAECFEITEGSDAELTGRYIACLIKLKQYAKAVDAGNRSIRKGRTDDNLVVQHKAAFVALNGSNKGYDEAVAKLRDAARNDSRKKVLEAMIDKPSVDFTLKALDGSTVTLSKLRGKVVVLDFWATWCGPCVSSFPFLQRVYDKYKDNPNVVILAVNTWENDKGAVREANVRKFLADKKYSFPVIFDSESGQTFDIVQKYNVEGIPTKFIIDKKGRVRFKDIGFSGGAEMMDKMDLQFDILLSNETSAR